jgi:hypothetical protein
LNPAGGAATGIEKRAGMPEVPGRRSRLVVGAVVAVACLGVVSGCSSSQAGGRRTRLYSSSLGIMMGSIFLMSWLVQSVAGRAAYNEDRLERRTLSAG